MADVVFCASHAVVQLTVCNFWLDHPELCKMPGCVRVLSAEGWPARSRACEIRKPDTCGSQLNSTYCLARHSWLCLVPWLAVPRGREMAVLFCHDDSNETRQLRSCTVRCLWCQDATVRSISGASGRIPRYVFGHVSCRQCTMESISHICCNQGLETAGSMIQSPPAI